MQAWNDLPNQIVGWFPRHSCKKEDGKLHYYTNVLAKGQHGKHAYSILLTKGAVMHKKWLEVYTNEMPAEMLDYVRVNKNCEDLAMQYLVSNRTGIPPQYVQIWGCERHLESSLQ
jgi:hypothetical protein